MYPTEVDFDTSNIGRDSNPRPSDLDPKLLSTWTNFFFDSYQIVLWNIKILFQTLTEDWEFSVPLNSRLRTTSCIMHHILHRCKFEMQKTRHFSSNIFISTSKYKLQSFPICLNYRIHIWQLIGDGLSWPLI